MKKIITITNYYNILNPKYRDWKEWMIFRGEKEENVSYENYFYPLFEKLNLYII